ncbi:uncharacterized protein LOC128558542 [Mercenaria mercenaria]|uniref:uncharacterized protein LOC128558542 n=1 Tax=Mercenaria mercenaria TaxID=6596 RepID=UPI00234F5140|nr:uncharacterized protein LOC128558542 [Mercenaria mercenaria]
MLLLWTVFIWNDGNVCPILLHSEKSPRCPFLLHNAERNIRFFTGTIIENQILQNSWVDDQVLEQALTVDRNVSVERIYDHETFQDQTNVTSEVDTEQPSFSIFTYDSLPDPEILYRSVGEETLPSVYHDDVFANLTIFETVGSYNPHSQDSRQASDIVSGGQATNEVSLNNSHYCPENELENISVAAGMNNRSVGHLNSEVSNIERAVNPDVRFTESLRIKIHTASQNIPVEMFQNIGSGSVSDMNVHTEECHELLALNYLSERLKSFNRWKRETIVKTFDLAIAGFYYTGHEDSVKCFCCNKILGHWEVGDVPWLEHAKHSPDCSYVKQNLSPNLIQAVGDGDEKEVKLFKNACLGVSDGTVEGACAASDAKVSITNVKTPAAKKNRRREKKNHRK